MNRNKIDPRHERTVYVVEERFPNSDKWRPAWDPGCKYFPQALRRREVFEENNKAWVNRPRTGGTPRRRSKFRIRLYIRAED